MASIGIILKNGLEASRRIKLPRQRDPWLNQQKVLFKLLQRAELTTFGTEYGFEEILRSHNRVEEFRARVPIHTYETMMRWWQMTVQGEDGVCWPGKVEYFALSSGTSSGSSKYIPVTRAMLRAMQRSSMKQIYSLAYCNLPDEFYEKNILMLGGSTNLEYNGIFYAGDLSGITTGRLPFWFQPFYKPGKGISATKNWQEKLEIITREAHNWDVGAIVGVPSWFQILMERIIAHHGVNNIHDIWPNLQVFVHGGVAFEPYKKGFEPLLGKPLIYLETYLASEGFIAYQSNPEAEGMRLLVKNGIFFEFIPFNNKNIDADGNAVAGCDILTLNKVVLGTEYVLVMSTVSGAWRYIIGDVIQFTDVLKYEMIIKGRTKHFLSLVGEHLSVDNMNKAIELASKELNIGIREFAVAGVNSGTLFAHHWYVSVSELIDAEQLAKVLDAKISQLNDDYAVERQHALHKIVVDIVPNEHFMGWLKNEGKEGAQIKFPRVLKDKQIDSFENFLVGKGVKITPSSFL
ncbi:MAG: GH3 auxin-responsive promoter family protein [Bacteroidota bacterium]|nr:GH3 auxin-responsive promoter family protein [Bacteroidota bacterium]